MGVIAYGSVAPAPPPVEPDCQVVIAGKAFVGKGPAVPDSAGVSRVFDDLAGWWNPVGSTGELVQRAYQSGAWAGKAYERSRNLVLKGTMFGWEDAAVREAFEEFLGALPIDVLFPVTVIEKGLTRHVLARREGEPIIDWRGGGGAKFDVQFAAPDYRRLSGDGKAPTHSVSAGLPSQTGGQVFPATFPAVFDATVVTGIIEITNAGTAPPPVIVRIDGPVSGPVIRTGDGQAMPFDITLDAGQFLDVDLDRKTVMLNGQASRRGTLRGRWITLKPGPNVLKFDAAAYDPSARFTASWYDAWK